MRKTISRFLLTGCVLLGLSFTAEGGVRPIRKHPHAIPNEYLVALEDDVLPEHVPDVARGLARSFGGDLRKTWRHAVKGFFVVMPPARAEALARHPHVKFVEENAQMFLSAVTPTKIDPATCDANGANCTATADNRLWHLDRLSQTWASGDGSATSCADGTGITVYVVDTGVVGQHQEFLRPNGTSRVQTGYDASDDLAGAFPANNPCRGFADPWDTSIEEHLYIDEVGESGHGTAVASVVAGRISGVAPNATIVPVKVASCEERSARTVERNTAYTVGDTVVVAGEGYRLWRASTNGVTASTEPEFNISLGSMTCDGATDTACTGGVRWERIESSHLNGRDLFTVQMQIDGLNWIVSQNAYDKTRAVLTMSTYQRVTALDANETTLLEDAVDAVAQIMPFVASANNQNADAGLTIPGRMSRTQPNVNLRSKVITAGGSMFVNAPDSIDPSVPSTDRPNGGASVDQLEPVYDPTQPTLDARWICGAGDASSCSTNQLGSNGGACITLFAPAKNVSVAMNTSATAYRTTTQRSIYGASGTSFSAPMVAGVLARILQVNNGITVDGAYDKLMENTLTGVMRDDTTYPLNPAGVTGTPNVLLNLSDVSVAPSGQPADQTASSSSPATLSVTASGIGTLTYQWYVVNSTFDLTNRRGARAASTLIAGATSATLSNLNPTTATGYWVLVKSGCAQVESNIAVVTPLTAVPPVDVVATAGSGGAVTITWTAAEDADSYDVERKVSPSGWSVIGNVTASANPSMSDPSPPAVNGIVLYRVKTVVGTARSSPSAHDIAYTLGFTDELVYDVAPYTGIKAEHLVEVRKAVNALRAVAGNAAFFDANATNVTAVRETPIDDSHIAEVMTQLSAARIHPNVGLSSVGFREQPQGDFPIRKTQIDDIRNGIR